MEKPGSLFAQGGTENLSQSEFLSKDADSFLKIFFFWVIFHIFTVANKLPGFCINRFANVEDFLNANVIVNINVSIKNVHLNIFVQYIT